MKKFLIFLFIFGYYLQTTISVFATPPIATFSPKITSSPSGEEKMEEKIQQIREVVKERVREKIEETKKGRPFAYVGKITQIGESTFILETKKTQVQIEVNSETKIIGIKKQNLELKDLKIGDFCIAMGYLEENEILLAKRVVVVSKPNPPLREIAFGRVTDISLEEKILTVKNEKRALVYTVQVNDKTIITKKGEKGIQKVQFSAIEINDWIVVVGNPSENEEKIITAKIIHVIPGLTRIKEKSSPSPTLKPSPTATPIE